MRKIYFVFITLTLFALTACGGGSSTESGTTTSSTEGVDTTTTPEEQNGTPSTYTNRDCAVNGQVLNGNKLVFPEKEIISYILADSTTYDDNFGDSHRVLVIKNSDNCEDIDRVILPVNNSPDYAYYLAKINYNNSSNLLGIRGFDKVFCYDLEAKKLLPALEAKYKNERYGEDAQSGMIMRVEVWEQFLIGYAKDEGAFAFDMKDPSNPKPVLPFAEYEINETSFASLFLFPSSDGGTQCLLPKFNVENDEFSINPLLDEPAELETNIPANALNNQFLVIRMKDDKKTPVAFDMKAFERVTLPEDIANKNTQEILAWLKAR